MVVHRPRITDKELFILQSLVYNKLSEFYEKEVTTESIELYRLLLKLLQQKGGRPSYEEITIDKISGILSENPYLMGKYGDINICAKDSREGL